MRPTHEAVPAPSWVNAAPDRRADPARQDRQGGETHALAQRHAAAVQRVRLDRVDDVAWPPAPDQIGDDAIDQAADAWDRDDPPRLDADPAAQVHFERHPEQEIMHSHDHIPHRGNAEGDAGAARHRHRGQPEVVVADVGAYEESGPDLQMRERAPATVKFFLDCAQRRTLSTSSAARCRWTGT
jgi:hypothetical protein